MHPVTFPSSPKIWCKRSERFNAPTNILKPITQPVPTKNPIPEPAATEDQANELLPQPSKEPTQLSYPVNIAPTRQTRTANKSTCHPVLVLLHTICHHLAQSAINSVADFHPLASLQTFVSSIVQPNGYPDTMPLHVALQQVDKDKFLEAMQQELQQHAE